MTDVTVHCTPVAAGWACHIDLRDGDGSATHHRVSATAADLVRLDPAATDPTDLVRRSFDFLLAREPKESILAAFDLMVIARYFPDFERTITERA